MKFEIVKGLDYTCKLIIKEDGSVTGLSLDPLDTARIMISTSGDNSTVAIDWISMAQTDAANGEFSVTIPAASTALLEAKVGFDEDKNPSVANYQAVFDTTTVEQGNKVYIIDGVFVKDVGL